MKKNFYAIKTFAIINARRFFRDKMAIFFTIAFPLIFLIIFGTIFNDGGGVSFKVALINQSNTQIAKSIAAQEHEIGILDIDESITTLEQAEEKMKRSELDAAIILPDDFGEKNVHGVPNGEMIIYYNQSNQQAVQALSSILQNQMNEVSKQYVDTYVPFTVKQQSTNIDSLTQFDYIFAGLLGFAIIGLGIFGPVNVFPELKKQGVLRRLHTTPLKVWEYFVANVLSQGFIGLIAIAIMLVVSLVLFDLQMVGNYLVFFAFVLVSIAMIYGIGLAIGGWAKNERQAAPLGNLISFPMIFLSGTFFPRFLMPEWLQSVTAYLPLTPVIDGIRLITTEGKGLIELGPQLAVISVWAVVIYFVAFRVFRWE